MKKQVYAFRFVFLISTLIFILSGCREIYEPEVDNQDGVLVVDGLITNLNEPSYVKLSIAKPYNSSSQFTVITRAQVMIQEDNQSNYHLNESDSGIYKTNPTLFIPKPGHTYTLQIITPNGEKYKSSPQIMLTPPIIDSVYGNISSKEYISKDIYGKMEGRMEKGAQTFIDFSSGTASLEHFRFKSTQLIGYTYIDYSTSPFPSVIYVWKKRNPDTKINITGAENPINTGTVKIYPVSFFPFNEYLYGMKSNEHIENWFLQIRQFCINDETYQYYKEMNKQLSSTGALFDPIASQISGNISCTSNPDKLVLGFFEASGCTKKSYYIKPQIDYFVADYLPTIDLDSIPDEGISVQTAPYFWRF